VKSNSAPFNDLLPFIFPGFGYANQNFSETPACYIAALVENKFHRKKAHPAVSEKTLMGQPPWPVMANNRFHINAVQIRSFFAIDP